MLSEWCVAKWRILTLNNQSSINKGSYELILADESEIGDSIAVNGVCLTITALNGRDASFDVSSETLTKSSLSQLTATAKVNIERAMKGVEISDKDEYWLEEYHRIIYGHQEDEISERIDSSTEELVGKLKKLIK